MPVGHIARFSIGKYHGMLPDTVKHFDWSVHVYKPIKWLKGEAVFVKLAFSTALGPFSSARVSVFEGNVYC